MGEPTWQPRWASRGADTTHCPRGCRCESCGAEGPGLVVAVRQTLGEQVCLTLCGTCAATGEPPTVTARTAERLAAQHREHRGPGVGE